MAELTQSVTNLINEFTKLPGIGKKSAERLAYHVLRTSRNDAEISSAVAHLWRSREDRYSALRTANTPASAKRVEMSYIGG